MPEKCTLNTHKPYAVDCQFNAYEIHDQNGYGFSGDFGSVRVEAFLKWAL